MNILPKMIDKYIIYDNLFSKNLELTERKKLKKNLEIFLKGREKMKNIKKIITVIFMVLLLMSFRVAQSSEVITPVPISDQSTKTKKFTVEKKENEKKYYFFCLQAQLEIGIVHFRDGIIIKEKSDTNLEVVLSDIRKYGATIFKCDKDKVIIIAFNRVD